MVKIVNNVVIHDKVIHDSTPYIAHMMLGILRMLRPHRVDGFEKVRLGRYFDGGYVMLDDFEGISAAYSLGINDDVSWDLDIARRGIPVFQYDHTILHLPEDHALFTWEKTGIGVFPDAEHSLETIPNLISRNGHEGRTDLLLKCDIENYEWGVFARVPHSTVRQFKQIVMELHGLGQAMDLATASLMRAAIENLTTSHRLVHVHANNFAPWCIAGGVAVPEVLEITLVRDDTGPMAISDEIFPTPLDMPCYVHQADHYLGTFTYA